MNALSCNVSQYIKIRSCRAVQFLHVITEQKPSTSSGTCSVSGSGGMKSPCSVNSRLPDLYLSELRPSCCRSTSGLRLFNLSDFSGPAHSSRLVSPLKRLPQQLSHSNCPHAATQDAWLWGTFVWSPRRLCCALIGLKEALWVNEISSGSSTLTERIPSLVLVTWEQ